jgi:uncharacterized protein YbbK (DUF523 family)
MFHNGSKKNIISEKGNDFTSEYVKGAEKVLVIAKIVNAEKAVLKSKSPSCGLGLIYDGTFHNKLIPGNGMTAELLLNNGIVDDFIIRFELYNIANQSRYPNATYHISIIKN